MLSLVKAVAINVVNVVVNVETVAIPAVKNVADAVSHAVEEYVKLFKNASVPLSHFAPLFLHLLLFYLRLLDSQRCQNGEPIVRNQFMFIL